MRKFLGLFAVSGILVLVAVGAAAQYPAKPIRLIVPFAPGGGTDFIARVLAQKMADAFGSSIVVDNRAGGGGAIGAETMVRAAPDGYTLMFDAASYTTRAAIYKLPYDPASDITPVGTLCESGYIVALHPAVPIRSIKEFIAYASEHPGKLNYGSSGVGGFTHLATELFVSTTKIKINHVPYKGTGPALNDLMGGQIQMVLGSLITTAPQIRANRLRGIAVTAGRRWREMPDLPTVSETVPGYEVSVWYGVLGPRNLPKEIVARWNKEITRIVRLPEMKERMSTEGLDPYINTPDQFAKIVQADLAKWSKVVKQANLKAAQ
jgi:tripartite-type tricarboxylate transporter receptor subunit TctC